MTGACYVEGRYYADELIADLARKQATERDQRWTRRREAFVARVAHAMGRVELDDEAELALQRESVALDPADVLDDGASTSPVRIRILCAWCAKEGVPALMQEGNDDLPPSHGICERHSMALLVFTRDGAA